MIAPRRRWRALSTAVAGNFGQFGARVAISPFVLAIATDFGTGTAQVGLVLTGMWAVYACFQFPSGVVADRYGERRVVILSLGLSVVGSVLVAVSPSLLWFGLAALVLGSGAGMYFAAGTALLDRQFEGTGFAFSVHSTGGPLAGLAVPVVATWVAATYGDWRTGIAVGGVAAGLGLLLATLALESMPPVSPDARLRDRLDLATVVELLSRPPVAFTTLLSVLGMYVFQSFVSFFPTFLQEHHALSQSRAGLATGVAFLLIAVAMPAVGALADRADRDAVIGMAFGATATGFALLIAIPGGGPAMWLGVAVVGAGLTWGGALQSRFMVEFADDERGTGFGLVRTVFVLLGSVGNVATGVLAEVAGWPAAYGVLVALLALAAALLAGNRLTRAGF